VNEQNNPSEMDGTPVSPNEIEELLCAYLRDEASDEQMLRLAELVQQDRQVAERVVSDAMIAGWFRAEGNPTFVTESVLLATRNRDTQFVRSVMNKLPPPVHATNDVVAPREVGGDTTGFIAPIRIGTGRHGAIGERGERAPSASSRQSRIERVAPRKDRWNWLIGVGMAAIFALYIFGRILMPFAADRITPVARITFIGSAGFIERDGRLILAEPEMLVGEGDIVKSGDVSVLGGRGLQFVFLNDEKTIVDLVENSDVRVSDGSTGKHLDLRRGKMIAAVQPQPEGKPLRLTTEFADVKVVGTRFSLEDGVKSTRLEVQEGKVELTRKADGESVEVQRGFFVDADSQKAPLEVAKSLEVPDGLLARWTFDEGKGQSSRDVTASGRAVALYGGTQWVEGRDGAALALDGSTGYADFGSTPDLNFASGQAFTYTGWFKSNDDNGLLVSQRHDQEEGAVIDIAIGNSGGGIHPGQLVVLVRQNGTPLNPWAKVVGPTVNDGRWHHFAVTRDSNGQIELFLDGTSRGTHRSAGAAGPINTNLRAFGDERFWVLRRPAGGPISRLQGALDDVRIYNRMLSVDEVRQLAK